MLPFDATFGDLDSTSVTVHKHGLGKKYEQQTIRRSRGGMTTKVHAVSADAKLPLRLVQSAGNRQDAPAGWRLPIKHSPKIDYLMMDRAYEDAATRRVAARRHPLQQTGRNLYRVCPTSYHCDRTSSAKC